MGIKIVHFHRRPSAGSYSVERLFATVRSVLTHTDVQVRICPFESTGLFKRLYNIVDAALRQRDVNHVTGDVNYLTLLLAKKRTILTIHDCRPMLRLRGLRRLVFQLLWLELPVNRCSLVTVISEHTKGELLRFTSCAADKIRIIPDPVGTDFRPAPNAFNSDHPRILQVGTSDNKNLAGLTAALSGIQCTLDVIGPLSPDARSRLDLAGIQYESATGLSDAEVAAKYRRTDLVAFCSTYEGFGMPIIEAQAVGRPVVTSNIDPMSEVAGGAACLVNPYDPRSIRAGILRIIHEPIYREDLVRKGFENVKRFSAEEVAHLYLQLYQELGTPRHSVTKTGPATKGAPVSWS